MIHMYLVATSELNRVLLYQYSEKSKINPGSWTLPCAEVKEVSEENLRVGLYKLFSAGMGKLELLDKIEDADGNSHVFFKGELTGDVEFKDKKADYGFYTFQQLPILTFEAPNRAFRSGFR